MKQLFLALALTIMMVARTDASVPPPPPPPPDELPESYDGYSTEALWYAYLFWVRAETFERRENAFKALALPKYNDDPQGWETALEGPNYESNSFWIPHGRYFAFEEICPSTPTGDDDECQWRYRSAFYDARADDIYRIVYDTFDGAAFAAFLAGQDVGPEAVTREYRSAFGLADTVHARLDAMIVSHDVREADCPAIGEMMARLSDTSVPLTPEEPEYDPSNPPEPPMPPGADAETLNFPLGYFPDAKATMTVSGNGSPAVRKLVTTLLEPVNACLKAEGN